MDRICLPSLGCLPDIWLLLAALAFIATLGLYSWWRRSVPGATMFAIACGFGFLWMLGILGQVMADQISAKITWYEFQFIWQVPGATATTCFSVEFAGYSRWLTRRNLRLLAIPPLLVPLIILTNDLHHLAWLGFTTGEVVRPIPGAGIWILTAYGWALIIVNIVVLARLFVRSQQHRWPVGFIITGQLVCRALFVVYLIRLDLLVTPYSLILAIMFPFAMYGIALFGFHIFDPLPRARRMAIEQMQEGMVVFDRNRRLLSVNPAAEKILRGSAAQLRGKTWHQVLPTPVKWTDRDQTPVCPEAAAHVHLPSHMVLETDAGAGSTWYEADLSPLKDRHESVVGWLLLLRDITAQRRAEAQRVKQEQMLAVIREREYLARELHDNLGQVFAFVNAQGQSARLLVARGELEAADGQLARLIEISRETDADIRDSILGLRVSLTERGLFSALSSYLEQYQQHHSICIHMRKSPDLVDGTLDPLVELQLLRIMQEALTNVRKHADARAVCIDFSGQDDVILVTLSDDGCGFDPREALGATGRLGLRVMSERAEEVGGSLTLRSRPGQGTEVRIVVPLTPPTCTYSTYVGDDHARPVG